MGRGDSPGVSALKKSPKTCLHSPKRILKSPKTAQATLPPPPPPTLLQKTLVPAEMSAETLCKELKLSPPPEPIILKQIKNESYNNVTSSSVPTSNQQQTQRLRPVRRSSTAVIPLEMLETESEESEEETEEEEEEEEEDDNEEEYVVATVGKRRKEKKVASKDDVVHCNCANNLDEGFMIQVRSTVYLITMYNTYIKCDFFVLAFVYFLIVLNKDLIVLPCIIILIV